KNRRLAQDLEALRKQAELDRARAEQERLRAAEAVGLQDLEHQAQVARGERDVALFRLQRAVENELSDANLRAQLIARLPEIAAALPKPEHLRAVNIGGDGTGAAASLLGYLAGLLRLGEKGAQVVGPTNGAKP